jgi:alkanesulfonate monooxygenase SsuD/methylene tetrahydromethanopterin reductase-like flavin-dependent oxidoreductase (luciferase family)
MKFSLIYEAQTVDSSREGDRKIFEDTVEQAVLADKLGFDTFWCVEHTALSNYSHMSALAKPNASALATAWSACRQR